MAKTSFNERRFNPSLLRALAAITIGWVVFITLLPSFLMRIFDFPIPWLSTTAWVVSLVLFAGVTGYLCLGFLRDQKISLLVCFGILLLFGSQVFRMGVNTGFVDRLVTMEHFRTLRAVDNLINGLGIAMIGLAFLYVLIEILASRQKLLNEHAQLSAEVMRREQVEKHLRAREALLRGIDVSTLDGIIVIDTVGCISHWNPAAERILGYGAAEIIGRPASEILLQTALYPPPINDTSARHRSRLGPVAGKITGFEAVTKAGSAIHVELSVSLMEIDGQWHTVGILRDVTERKRMEQERNALQTQMQYAQKLEGLGILAGGIAHDFNNILQVILGNINLLEIQVAQKVPSRGSIEKVKKAIDRASALTHQMLAYSGKGAFAIETLNIDVVVHEMIQLIQSSVSKKTILQTDLAKDLPPVDADLTQLEQVLMNLVLNAAEALNEARGGTVTISTMLLHCTEDYLSRSPALYKAPAGAYVCLEVSDTGHGMNEETVEKLFDPFFTTKFTGRGLGMSAVLGIMTAHKGAIVVESTPGAGTSIRALFPASTNVVPTPPDKQLPVPITMPRKTGVVLIVDDEPDALDLGAAMLEQLGYTPITAVDGLQAIELFTQRYKEIDCVILDLNMPVMDGIQTLQELRRIKPTVRAILASGYSEEELESHMVGHEISGFLIKPYDIQALMEALARALP